MDELWSSKMLRDRRARALRAQGYRVTRYTTGRVQLHPMYIEDQKHTPSGQDQGFGNTSYTRLWNNLYGVKTISTAQPTEHIL